MYLLISSEDEAKINAERLERLWKDEKNKCKENGTPPSLSRVVWRFGKTRFIIALILVFFAMILQFVTTVSFSFLPSHLFRVHILVNSYPTDSGIP